MALEYAVKRRGRHPQPRGQTGRAKRVTPTEFDDATLHASRRFRGAGPRPARTILQAHNAGLLESGPPFVRCLPGDVHRLGSSSDGPPGIDALAQAEPTFGGERSITVHGEPPGRV